MLTQELFEKAYGTDAYYAILNPEGIFFAESPEEQGLEESAPQESLLRLFLSKDDADAYCDYVKIIYGDMRVSEVTLKDVWYLLDDIDALSMEHYKCPVRVAVCVLDDESWPIEVDTFHGAYMVPN
jgi:hypothetical protein